MNRPATALIPCALFALIGFTVPLQATIVNANNPGSTLGTAQVIPAGSSPLTDIVGSINNDSSQVELFEIYLTDGVSFSATTVSNTSNFFDTELFLFNSSGDGVFANNDDLNAGGNQSTLPSGNTYSPATPGYYYLAITSNGIEPFSSGGAIFDLANNPAYAVLGPNGPGGASLLTGWQGTSTEVGTATYDIALTGVSVASATSVPEPSFAVLLFAAFMILLVVKRKALRLPGTLVAFVAATLHAQEIPANLGGGLGDLVRGGRAAESMKSHLMMDKANRVLVQIFLDGKVPPPAMERRVAELGGRVVAVDKEWRNGVVDAYIPVPAAAKLAAETGVRSITLSRKPQVHPPSTVPPYAGPVTPGTQSGTGIGPGNTPMTNLEHTDAANLAGYKGAGITVGVTSDSYNSTGCGTNAVALGYLPAAGVTVLNDEAGSDEGCAMAQLVFDVAPSAKLCFAAAGSESAFANNIRALRTNSACYADIIADDIGYVDEPFFSDGQIANAVQAVVNTPANGTMPGKPVSYFVYQGNNGNNAYQTTFNQITDAAGRAMSPALVANISASLTGGGFENFGSASNPSIALPVTIPANTDFGPSNGTLSLFWDDPFNANAVTTDYNIFIVDGAGNILASGTDNNIATDQPIELISYANTNTSNSNFYLIVSRTSAGTHLANRLLILENDNGAQYIFFPLGITGPTIFGHSSATSANAVSSVNFGGQTTAPFYPYLNSYSSPGPVTIAFDSNNSRLPVAQVRKKPDMAAITENTVVFFEGNFKSFGGTSAAAPAAAGIAALMMQKAGGPQSLTPAQVHSYMIASGPSRDVDLFTATASTAGLTVTSTDAIPAFFSLASTPAPFDTTFKVSFSKAGQTLSSLKIDLSGISGGAFVTDPASSGYAFRLDSASAGVSVTSTALSNNNATLTVNFSGFASGDSVSFDLGTTAAYPSPLTITYGGFSDLITGAPVTATLSSGTLAATFANVVGKAWNNYDGYGIVNAATALSKIP